jgi:hypothetical protein
VAGGTSVSLITVSNCSTSTQLHQHPNTYKLQRNLKYVVGNTSYTFTLDSLSCSRRVTHTALTDTVQSRHTPGQNPGSPGAGLNPCNGATTSPDWRVDRGGHTCTGMGTWHGMVCWYGMARGA